MTHNLGDIVSAGPKGEVPDGHIGIGPDEPRITALHRQFTGNEFQQFFWDVYLYCCGPHSQPPGMTCRDCTMNMIRNHALYPNRNVGETVPVPPNPPIEDDLRNRWFEIREISPDSGRGITPFEDATGFRTTGQSGNTFGNV